MKKKIIISLLAAFISLTLIALIFFYGWHKSSAFLTSKLTLSEEKEYSVTSGSGLLNVLLDWNEAGYISGIPPFFIHYLRLKKISTKILLGDYLLTPGLTLTEALEKLLSGAVIDYQWSIIEGTTIKEILESLKSTDHIIYDLPEIKYRKDYIKLSEFLGLDKKNPEGLFFSDTYHFIKNMKASQLLRTSADRLKLILSEEWGKRGKNLPYKNSYQVLIMASIIEKETGKKDERKRIAGVFTSRLKKGMRLQTDPTVIYGIGDSYDGNITRKHLMERTDYNTYKIPHLPPTPIASVGIEAINAALNPIEDGYIYFVSRGDGSHYFSKTLIEHQRAVIRFQINRNRYKNKK